MLCSLRLDVLYLNEAHAAKPSVAIFQRRLDTTENLYESFVAFFVQAVEGKLYLNITWIMLI